MNMQRRAEWLTRLEQWTERPLTILAVLWLPLLLAPFLFDLSPEVESAFLAADYAIWALFAADLVAKVTLATDRPAYLRRHWLDALLVIVPILRPLRAMRALRFLWAVGAAGRVLAGCQRLFSRRGTGYLLVSAVVVVVLAAALIVAVERDDPAASIVTFGDGLWWAMTTVTTIGYGDLIPRTAAGRGIAVALMLLGIAAFGLVTANLAALFVEEQDDDVRAELREVNERLRRIEAAIESARSEGDRA
jgi:voltage-gated potassium channel